MWLMKTQFSSMQELLMRIEPTVRTTKCLHNFYTENPSLNFVNKKEASYRILEEMDAVRPYLKRRYVIINNIDYEYTDYTSVPGSGIVYTVRGSLTLERIFNTQIPDEDQAIEW